MILKVAGKSPPWLANFLRAFAPFVTLTFTILNIVGPVVIKFYGLLYKVSAALVWGLLAWLCFRGLAPGSLHLVYLRPCSCSLASSSCILYPHDTTVL